VISLACHYRSQVAAGRIVAAPDWRAAVDELEPWQQRLLGAALAKDVLTNR
jgi:hypothetical protein